MPRPTCRPSTPGWYWVRAFRSTMWTITRVVKIDGQIHARDPYFDIVHPIALTDQFWDDAEWLGPITPEDAIRMAQLKATGSCLIESLEESACRFEDDATALKRVLAASNTLAEVAKEAAVHLDSSDNAPIRDRLRDAIDGWIVTVGVSPKSRFDA